MRATLSLFDLLGVMAIGVVAASIALFLTEGSDPNRTLVFAGFEIPAANITSLPVYAGLVLTLFLSKSLFAVILARKSAMFLAAIDARAAKAVASQLYGSGLATAQGKSREEAIFAIQAGSSSAFSGVLNAVSTAVSEVVLFVLISVGFFLVDLLATFYILIYFLTLALLINYALGRRIKLYGATTVKSSVKTTSVIADLLAVFREVSTTGEKHNFFDRIYSAKLDASRSAAIQSHLSALPRYIIESALLLGFAALILFQVSSEDIVQTATTLSVFLAGGFRLTAAIVPLQTSFLGLKGNLPRATTALEVLEQAGYEIPNRDSKNRASIPLLASEAIGIRLQDISFSHSNSKSPAVVNVSMSIEPGSKVAIIGESGAGKSTIADLICGIITPDLGQVLLTSGDKTYSPNDFYGQIGYVPQRPNLISGDIASNVALGVKPEDIDLRNVELALRQAHLWDLVAALPDQLRTDVGNLRDNLSGGEIQRIGLARALYTEPKLLVMDEATSSLDASSEHEVSKVLNALKGKTTLVVIAHRLNTVQNSDKVFLMDSGNLVDVGTFSELVARNPNLEKTVNLLRID